MLTESKIAELSIMWDGGSWGGRYARPHSDVRRGLSRFLFEYACGECVFCGDGLTPGAWEVCHIFSAGGQGNERRGFVAGNLAAGCAKCNQDHAERFVNVPLSEIRNPAGVPTTWPRLVELRNSGKALKAA